jgi:4-hydroxy-tetrahydrodipicolinate reductase
MATIKVLVNGAKGRMGQETVRAVQQEDGLELVGEADLGEDFRAIIISNGAEVVVDFTSPTAVFSNTKTIIEAGAHPVIGTTGLSHEEIAELKALCLQKRLGGIVAPNFAVGAVLMMRFCKEAARYFPHAEIIELHHDGKLDAPSGTAIKTADMIAEARPLTPQPRDEKEILVGARGATCTGIHIHSVRLPGLIAHQEVIFGGKGQILTIRHDSFDRESFMPGVCLACKRVVDLQELVYGLENIL